jgi:hypothetical protein
MKLPRTVGLAVAVLLVVATVAAPPAWISGAAPAGSTVDADVSLVKSLRRTEQLEKRGYAVALPLSETTHGPSHEMSNGLSIAGTYPAQESLFLFTKPSGKLACFACPAARQ